MAGKDRLLEEKHISCSVTVNLIKVCIFFFVLFLVLIVVAASLEFFMCTVPQSSSALTSKS